MDALFLDNSDRAVFYRDDMEEGHWVQEEMSLTAVFPYVEEKPIERGTRILFPDPATGETEAFEIRNVQNVESDHYQQITAEHIVISELTDEHIDEKDFTDISAADALRNVLAGTLWRVGNVSSSGTSSADIGRGSVWQAICTIRSSWNVYIEPRIVIGESGITGRFLDITPAGGTWRGVRLSIDKNITDPSVTYDDSEIITAMYGYGGSTDDGGDDSPGVLQFTDVAWSRTAGHPAKPAGQKYLEDPDATALYGRNGRPRYGYYQNSDIHSAETLLEKTWEALKAASKPKVTIEATVADLARLGYADQPLRLHDLALVEVSPIAFRTQLEIIQMDTDLIDPSATRVTIGAYIPNIIYLSRETEQHATGESHGGGNRSGKTKNDVVYDGFATEILKNNTQIKLRAYQYDMDDIDKILQEAGIVITKGGVRQYAWKDKGTIYGIVNTTAESLTSDYVNRNEQTESHIRQTADQIRTEVRNTADGLHSEIKQTKDEISLLVQDTTDELKASIDVQKDRIGLLVEGTGANARIKPASIVASINNGASTIKLSADHIDIDGLITRLQADFTKVNTLQINGNLNVSGPSMMYGGAWASQFVLIDGWQALNVIDASVSGNTLTIKRATGGNLTFSKATSLSGKWSSGTFKVTASPQNVSKTTRIASVEATDTPSSPSGYPKILSVPLKVTVYAPDAEQQSDSGYTSTKQFNASAVWDNGYDSGYAVTSSQVSGSNVSTVSQSAGSSVISGRRSLGTVSRPSVASYLLVTVNVHGSGIPCYITLN